jgi:chemotaxis protein MotA
MILQVIISFFLTVTIFYLAFNLEVGGMGLGSNLKALMIVLGGTFSATLIAYPWKRLIWTGQLLKKAFLQKNEIDQTITSLVSLNRTYRLSGIRALEQQVSKLSQGLLKTALELITFHYTREKIELILQKESQLTYDQYETAYKILYNMARLAPALGLAGTTVNLIHIFGHINNPQSLIGYMAIALLSTFYGIVLANLCFIPLSNKLREFIDHETIHLGLIQEGVLDLYDKENPTAMEYKLEALFSTAVHSISNRTRPKLRIMPSMDRVSSVTS